MKTLFAETNSIILVLSKLFWYPYHNHRDILMTHFQNDGIHTGTFYDAFGGIQLFSYVCKRGYVCVATILDNEQTQFDELKTLKDH